MSRQGATVTIGNTRGVHGRVAARLAEIARVHGTAILITRGEETVDCSSVLDVLAMALVQGTEIHVQAEGEQAGQALLAATGVLTSQDDP